LASAIAAILAWIAKIRWSREFRDAKEAQLEELRQHIATLERLSPPALLSWVQSVQGIAEKQVSVLENQLKEKEQDLSEYQRDVEQLVRTDQIRYEIIREAEKQREEARTELEETKAALAELRRIQVESRGLRETVRSTRPSRLNLPSTATWDVEEANALFKIWRRAQVNLSELKSGDNISERRSQELEEFANRVASDERFAREVLDNVSADPSYYNFLKRPANLKQK
jgi:hypothetical protein